MRPFKLEALKALTELPKADSAYWLVNAEGSVDYLKDNSTNDEIAIYAIGKSLLIHGVLARSDKVTPADGADLQNSIFPMPDDSWCIQQVWGGGEGHRIGLLVNKSFEFNGCRRIN